MAVGDTTPGRRVADVADPREPHPMMQPGEYRKVDRYPPDGATIWECCTPNGSAGNLSRHDVVEHEDETITVSPSILVDSPGQPERGWHGYLERGVWREV